MSDLPSNSNGHQWRTFRGAVACKSCGLVRRADDRNRQCVGIVKVALRGQPASGEAHE